MRVIGHSLVSLACSSLLAGATLCKAEERITVAGSSTVRPVVEKAAEAFKKANPDVTFAVGGGGSSHGVKSAGTGEVSIGMASRNLKDKEKNQFSDLHPVQIGMDGIAVIVSAKNPLTKITKQQIQDIYTGKVTNWKQLGGEDAKILLISKEEGRSTLDLFLKYFALESNELVKSGKPVGMQHRKVGDSEFGKVTARLIGPNREALALVSLKRNAIAYVSVGTAQEVARKGARIRLLDLDGVAATIENVAAETYPLRRPLNIMTKGPAEGTVKAFVDFLTQAEGQQIVRDLEFIPTE